MERILELLEQATVKILSSKGGEFIGTGFFITGNLLLTAGHNCKRDTINIYYPSQDCSFEGHVLQGTSSSAHDYVLIQINDKIDVQAVLLGEKSEIGEELYTYGYSLQNVNGDPVTFKFEGKSKDGKNQGLHKVKDGNIQKGMSGAPVFNVNSGQVIGIVVQTRSLNSAGGGYFLSIGEIKSEISGSIVDNWRWHLTHTEWHRNNLAMKNGIGELDATWNQPNHFCIFPNYAYPVEEVFIDPSYSVLTFDGRTNTKIDYSREVIDKCKELLNDTPILLITGAYGSGKTLISKCLQKKLQKDGIDTVFVKANDLLGYAGFNGLSNAIIARQNLGLHQVLFFDAFDELSAIEDRGISKKIELLYTHLVETAFRLGLQMVINYRTLENEDMAAQIKMPCEVIMQKFQKQQLSIIRLHYYTTDQVERWISKFAFWMECNGIKQQLHISDIESVNKNFKKACHNPLLLYIVNQDFYSQSFESAVVSNMYDLYKKFVESTAKGKFSQESIRGNQTILIIAEQYIDFLKEIAFQIAVDSDEFTVYYSDPNEWFLDRNSESYSVSKERVSAHVSNFLKDIHPLLANIHLNEDEKLLNCYFFEQREGTWKFRDNNILFFFLAEKIHDALQESAALSDKGKSIEDQFAVVSSLAHIPLHPVIIEILLNKIKGADSKSIQNFSFFLHELIIRGIIFNLPDKGQDFRIDGSKLNLEILLAILYIQLNEGSYKDIPFFFKRLNWLLSMERRSNPRMLFLTKRFFKSAKFCQAEFRRLNLKGFNFDYAKFKDVSFIQSKLHDTRCNYSKFTTVKYLLCDFSNTEMRHISGDIFFENCMIRHLIIDDPEEGIKLKFAGCTIIDLQINGHKKHINASFSNCIAHLITFNNCLSKSFVFESNIIYSVKFIDCRMEYTVSKNQFINHTDFIVEGKSNLEKVN